MPGKVIIGLLAVITSLSAITAKNSHCAPLAARATNADTGHAKAMASKNDINVAWKVAESIKEDVNGVEVPEADISVVVNGKAVNLGRFTGYPTPVTDKKSGMPDYCISACKTWFGGEGEDLCIRRKADKLEVLHRHVDEADAKPDRFKKIKEISLR